MARGALLDRITVDEALPGTLHEQLGVGIRRQISAGALHPGDRLPTVREIAKRCGLSSFTVQRAMGELTREGLVEGRRGAGTFVAEPRIRSTEVVFGHRPPRTWSALGPFYDQIFDGLRQAYADSIRRLCATYVDGEAPTAPELLSVCAARNADGIVAYRPAGGLADALRIVSHRIPTVALSRPIPNAPAECIAVEPRPAVQRLLETRLAKGRRRFVFAGFQTSVGAPAEELSPYRAIYEAVNATLDAAGVPAVCCLHPSDDIIGPEADKDIRAWFAPRIAELPEDAVVIMQNPHLADTLGAWVQGRDIITYTESQATRDAFHGRLTILYMGLERLAEEAGRRLQEIARSGNVTHGSIIRLEPEILTP